MNKLKSLIGCILILFGFMPIFAMAGSINGSISLPPGSYTLPQDLTLFIRATATADSPTNDLQQRSITFPDTDVPGTVRAFPEIPLLNDHDYTLQYDCSTFSSPLVCQRIVARLFYNDGTPTDMVLREADAQVFDGNVNTTGITLPIQSGTRFSGTLSLPDGALAAGDISFVVIARAVADPNLTSLQVTGEIPSGQNSTSIEVHVPDDSADSWLVGYSCSSQLDPDCGDFQREGYFKASADNNTVEDFNDGDQLAGDVDRTDIDIELLDGFTISGTITAPLEVTAAEGIRLNVRARDRNDASDVSVTTVIIAQGESSASYSLTVSLDNSAEWIVSYSCDSSSTPDECSKYLQGGLYDDGGTVSSENLVDPPLAGGQSHTGIDMTLLTGPSLSGTLMLSDGVAPFGGLNFTVRAAETTGSGTQFSQFLTIAEGDTQADFSIRVGDDNGYQFRLSYNCNESLTPECERVTDELFYDADTMTMVATIGEAASLMNNGADFMGLVLTVESPGLVDDEICIPIKTVQQSFAVVCF